MPDLKTNITGGPGHVHAMLAWARVGEEEQAEATQSASRKGGDKINSTATSTDGEDPEGPLLLKNTDTVTRIPPSISMIQKNGTTVFFRPCRMVRLQAHIAIRIRVDIYALKMCFPISNEFIPRMD